MGDVGEGRRLRDPDALNPEQMAHLAKRRITRLLDLIGDESLPPSLLEAEVVLVEQAVNSLLDRARKAAESPTRKTEEQLLARFRNGIYP
jgi:hypothetical protein